MSSDLNTAVRIAHNRNTGTYGWPAEAQDNYTEKGKLVKNKLRSNWKGKVFIGGTKQHIILENKEKWQDIKKRFWKEKKIQYDSATD